MVATRSAYDLAQKFAEAQIGSAYTLWDKWSRRRLPTNNILTQAQDNVRRTTRYG